MLHLSVPLAGAMLAQMGMGLTDTILLGSVGRDALAAGGLGGSIFFMFSGLFQNVIASVAILIAHARGAGDTSQVDGVLRAGLILALLAALPLMLMLWNVEPLLLWIGEPPALAADVKVYVRVIVIGAPAGMIMATWRFYLSAMTRPRLILGIAILGLIANGLLDYGLIYGVWGLPELGYLGSSVATALVLWVMAATAAAAIYLDTTLRPARLFARIDWTVFKELNRLGWPIAGTFSVETLLFLTGALLMGTFGATALAAHQVSIMIAATAFMVPLAIGQAANVRIGYHNGAGLPHAAGRAGVIALVIGLTFMSVTAVIMTVFPTELALLFQLDPNDIEDAAVIALVVELLGICALFQIFDGAQAIGAGILRGYKDTRVPLLLAILGYWGVGFPAAWTLAFTLDQGPVGLWWGLAAGLASAAVLLCGRFFIIGRQHKP